MQAWSQHFPPRPSPAHGLLDGHTEPDLWEPSLCCACGCQRQVCPGHSFISGRLGSVRVGMGSANRDAVEAAGFVVQVGGRASGAPAAAPGAGGHVGKGWRGLDMPCGLFLKSAFKPRHIRTNSLNQFIDLLRCVFKCWFPQNDRPLCYPGF